LTDRHSPVIFEAARQAQYASLPLFMAAVLSNPLHLRRTVDPGYNILTYRGCGLEAKEITFNLANNEISRIGAQLVNYTPEAFESPWLEGRYGSGVVTVRKGADRLVLDFNPVR
jgi:hypothetical protein